MKLERVQFNLKESIMKKSIIATTVAVSILATGAFAYNKSGCDMQGKQGTKKVKMMKKGMHGMSFVKFFKQLNLSEEQQTKLQKIMEDASKKRELMFSAFSADKFDKDKFIKQAMNKKENMVKLRADVLEKAYNVLDKKQKNQLRVLMDLQEEKGMTFDRYRHGRG